MKDYLLFSLWQRMKTGTPLFVFFRIFMSERKTPVFWVPIISTVVLNELSQCYRAKPIDIHSSVECPWELRQYAVYLLFGVVNVSMYHITALYVDNRIVTKCDVPPSIVYFEKVCYRFKIVQKHLLVFNTGIVVASNKMLVPMQITQLHLRKRGAVTANISDEIHSILVCDDLIPMIYENLIHFLHGAKGTGGFVKYILVAKMEIRCIKNHSNPHLK